MNFIESFKNLKTIEEIDDTNCSENVHSFTKLFTTGSNNEENFSNDFYSHCGSGEQKTKIQPLLNLYYELI